MTNVILRVLFIFLSKGVFGFQTDGVKSLSVDEGESVTLEPCLNDVQKYNIQWTFATENLPIAQFTYDKNILIHDETDRFRDRLKMNSETGSLTIKNIRTFHSGVYVADISSTGGSSKKTFNVTVGGFDPDACKITEVFEQEGRSFSLNTNIEVQKDHLMLWTFVKASKNCVCDPLHMTPCLSDNTPIARIDGETLEPSYDAGDNEMFLKMLKMDKTTGSLTVTNIRPEHSGFYIVKIINNARTAYRIFNVTVGASSKCNLHDVWKPLAIVLLVILIVLLVILVVWRIKKQNCSPSGHHSPTPVSQNDCMERQDETRRNNR